MAGQLRPCCSPHAAKGPQQVVPRAWGAPAAHRTEHGGIRAPPGLHKQGPGAAQNKFNFLELQTT